ncbi:hypothetical protein BD289DRAFT_447153 [Coniella lustricola]|uniref:Zn(2)-C6 fungal-type domain-containing protein n=1 Tax=Coniella lustricola TaxID=2025994 RepID=A0A2T2ZTC9_9PEZI|nr:hypothetical protein BD289DRAFT_447153 [Coniella lustricola]
MVYCGKPSMGCGTCRTRRIKCDETKPVCNQCIKSRRHCAGYRSGFDILHRDETQATAKRAKRQAEKKAAKKAAETGGTVIKFEPVQINGNHNHSQNNNNNNNNRQISPTSASSSSASAPTTPVRLSPVHVLFPLAPPAIPLDQHASHYFASHFIMLPGQSGRQVGHLEYLLPLLRAETNPNSPLQLAYSACGLAAMSNREMAVSGDLVDVSFLQHTRAIRAVAEALQDPVRCKTDATLASVLLLCFFEKITASKENGLLAWRTHIEGAIHIIRQRGKEMTASKYSAGLFDAIRLNIIARSLSSGSAPAMGLEWWLRESEITDPIGVRAQRFCLQICEIRAEAARLMTTLPHNETGVEIMLEMLQKVKSLDREIALWCKHLPEEYQAQVLYYEDRPIEPGALRKAPVFPGPVLMYRDVVIASMWNALRASRIIFGSLLIRLVAWICWPADYHVAPDYMTAVRTIRMLISELVSTTPYMLNSFDDKQQAFAAIQGRGVNTGNFSCGADMQSKMVGGLMASWPLSTIRTCDFTTDDQREWCLGRLASIEKDMGIKYAGALASTKIRFPSMLIRRDGLPTAHDPLKEIKMTVAVRPVQAT